MSHKNHGASQRTATSLDTRNGINLEVGGSLCLIAVILVLVVVIVVVVLAHLCGGESILGTGRVNKGHQIINGERQTDERGKEKKG